MKSRVRQIVLGEDNPAAYSHYSHQKAYRALIEMDKAVATLGHLPDSQLMYLGPRAHINTYPIGGGKFMNIVAFVYDNDDWPDNENLSAPAPKADVVNAFSKFGPAVRAMIDLLPEQVDRWAIFDTLDHPLPSFAYDRVITVLWPAWAWNRH
jgi:salicylate hydroxylase